MILQPFVTGIAASVAFVCGPGQSIPLVPAAQHLSTDGRFRYQGGSLPLAPALADRAVRSAESAIAAVPALAGYVGVDVVLGEVDDGSQDWVIEMNPRLTTSYLGLRALALDNLAEMMARVARGEKVEPPRWKRKQVSFLADGTILE
jgi:predicted ATP-grasp superfamily ATP-dependent carboligase